MRVLLLLVLLVGIPLIAGVNYMRNAPLDRELEQRPYAGITDADLAALLAAYGEEVERARTVVSDEPGANSFSDPGRFGHYGEKVEAFEKFQHTNEAWKRARVQFAGQQTTFQALQHEKSIRDRRLHEPLPRIWRRVSTF